MGAEVRCEQTSLAFADSDGTMSDDHVDFCEGEARVGGSFTLNYLYTAASDNGNMDGGPTASPIAEPNLLALLTVGLVVLGFTQQRKPGW